MVQSSDLQHTLRLCAMPAKALRNVKGRQAKRMSTSRSKILKTATCRSTRNDKSTPSNRRRSLANLSPTSQQLEKVRRAATTLSAFLVCSTDHSIKNTADKSHLVVGTLAMLLCTGAYTHSSLKQVSA